MMLKKGDFSVSVAKRNRVQTVKPRQFKVGVKGEREVHKNPSDLFLLVIEVFCSSTFPIIGPDNS